MLLGRSAMCNKVWKVEEVSKLYGHFSWQPCAFYASASRSLLLSLILIDLTVDFTVAAFWLSAILFFHQSPLALNFMPFWCRDNETTSTATALGMINLHKYTQLFVNKIFLVAFLSGTGVCAQATSLTAVLTGMEVAFLSRTEVHANQEHLLHDQ